MTQSAQDRFFRTPKPEVAYPAGSSYLKSEILLPPPEIQPGPDTDRLVAEAIGVSFRMECGVCVIKHDGIIKEFEPSIDLNDTFWAAEQVGLFGFNERFLSGSSIWEWFDTPPPRCVNDPPFIDMVLEADTPAMAICKAILALKEKQ